MGFSSIYRSLVEIFPQIDARILRAVAIEHPKDADVAVGVVLSEIIPSLSPNAALNGTVSLAVGHSNDTSNVSTVSNELVFHLDEASNMPPNGGGSAVHKYAESEKFLFPGEAPEDDELVTEDMRLAADGVQGFDGHLAGEFKTVNNGTFDQAEPASLVNAAHWQEDLNTGKLATDNQVEFGSGSSNNAYETLKDSENSSRGVADEADGAFSTIVTRSAQVCSIDLLNDIIADAKSNKKTLFTVMESVMNLMREVELQEKAAEEAKEEAARGSQVTLQKVEELKKMLDHAREANDMHAGEVYGERSILATEVKELESRLLNLSEERDRSLAILDEMREKLETRLVAAQEMKQAAEQEKRDKEDSARKVLAEQEAMMEKVIQESKLLHQEAEENSKMREFLMDRGQIVDSLQGEISVICQDVRLLKERLDKRVPLSESILSSQTSCRLASSGLSSKSVMKSPAASASQEDENDNAKERLEDGWDIVDKQIVRPGTSFVIQIQQ